MFYVFTCEGDGTWHVTETEELENVLTCSNHGIALGESKINQFVSILLSLSSLKEVSGEIRELVTKWASEHSSTPKSYIPYVPTGVSRTVAFALYESGT